MSSRDELPTVDTLRVKIAEESDARKETSRSFVQNALIAGKPEIKNAQNNHGRRDRLGKGNVGNKDSKMKCFKCGKIGHRARNCQNSKETGGQFASGAEDVSLLTNPETSVDKAFSTVRGSNRGIWCFDSGCTSHMCNDANSFVKVTHDGEKRKLNLANSARTDILGKGVVSTETVENGNVKVLKLSDTLYVPDLRTNLLSIGKIADKGHDVVFNKTEVKVIDCDGKVLIAGKREGGLYYLHEVCKSECKNVREFDVVRTPKKDSLEDWHIRMGHLNVQSLRQAIRKGSIQGVKVENLNENFQCTVCFRGKMCRPPFPKASERITNVGDLIHTDVCGPMRVASNGKKKYFITFIDDRSRWCEVKFLCHKSEAIEEFEKFRRFMETQKSTKIKQLQSDNGREFENRKFDELLQKNGITRRLTAPYNPEQNGIAERRNRTLMENCKVLIN